MKAMLKIVQLYDSQQYNPLEMHMSPDWLSVEPLNYPSKQYSGYNTLTNIDQTMPQYDVCQCNAICFLQPTLNKVYLL